VVDYSGLTEQDVVELCEELEGRLEAGVCDDSVCAGSLALVRAMPEVIHALDLYRNRLKICRAQLRLVRGAKSSAKKSRG
jgi:hypothetical protein